MKIFTLIILSLVALCELWVTFGIPLKTMYEDFWVNQSFVGKVTANIFYAPAWILKGLIYWLVIIFYWVIFSIRYVFTVLYRILKVLYNKVLSFML
jgi:hypothetical protein